MPARVITFGYKEWAGATNARRFSTVLRKHMGRATELNGLVGAREQRRTIASGKLAANAALTVFIKGSAKPLVDFADLYGSITYEVINEFTVFVGVLRADEEGFNIAMALHEGTQAKVTPAMRGMFLYLWKASTGVIPASQLYGRAAELWARKPGGWLPLDPSTEVITTPRRPWVEITFQDGAFKAKIQQNWEQALDAVFRELAGRGGPAESKTSKAIKKATKKARRAAKALGGMAKKLNRKAKGFGKKASKFGKKANRIGKRVTKKVVKQAGRKVRSVRRSIKRALK